MCVAVCCSVLQCVAVCCSVRGKGHMPGLSEIKCGGGVSVRGEREREREREQGRLGKKR